MCKRARRWRPRTAQLLSTTLLLQSALEPLEGKKGRLLEIGTGEGKSCVIAMFAVVMAKLGRKVDIMTSSPVLAERDCKDWQEFYNLFGVSAGTNVHDTDEEDRVTFYKHAIVYGTIHSFAGDLLREEFSMKKTRDIKCGRSFDIAIVDEVDLMTLDQGVQSTYLGHFMVGVRHLEPILATIWSRVSQHTPINIQQDATLFASSPCFLFDAILRAVVTADSCFKTSADLMGFAISQNIIDCPELGKRLVNRDVSIAAAAWSTISNTSIFSILYALEEVFNVNFHLYEMDHVTGQMTPY